MNQHYPRHPAIDTTARQIKAARALLGWTQSELAARASCSFVTISRGEKNGQISQPMIDRLAAVMKRHGIEFQTTGRRQGVTLVKPDLFARE